MERNREGSIQWRGLEMFDNCRRGSRYAHATPKASGYVGLAGLRQEEIIHNVQTFSPILERLLTLQVVNLALLVVLRYRVYGWSREWLI